MGAKENRFSLTLISKTLLGKNFLTRSFCLCGIKRNFVRAIRVRRSFPIPYQVVYASLVGEIVFKLEEPHDRKL